MDQIRSVVVTIAVECGPEGELTGTHTVLVNGRPCSEPTQVALVLAGGIELTITDKIDNLQQARAVAKQCRNVAGQLVDTQLAHLEAALIRVQSLLDTKVSRLQEWADKQQEPAVDEPWEENDQALWGEAERWGKLEEGQENG